MNLRRDAVQVCEVSSFWDLVVVSTMIDEGRLGAPARRILVVANCGDVPETERRIQENPAFARLAAAFDAVIDYNDTVHPLHPTQWRPQRFEEPLWERGFRALWGLGDAPVELVVENVQRPPGLSLGLVFADAPVLAYYDNLRARTAGAAALPVRLGARLDEVAHLDRGTPSQGLTDRPVRVSSIAPAAVRRTQRRAGTGLLERLVWDPAFGLPQVRGFRVVRAARKLLKSERAAVEVPR